MNNTKILKISVVVFLVFANQLVRSGNKAFSFINGNNLKVQLSDNEAEVVKTAFDIFSKDYQKVFRGKVISEKNANVLIATIGQNNLVEKFVSATDLKDLQSRREGFLLEVKDGKLLILGSDKRGTAYGILELSRMMGVSPWEWWADSPVLEKKKLTLKNGFHTIQSPSVKHRGIFINDEDWGLTPWSYKTFEPSNIKGQIGPKTHARIFELLLRLRANTFWPAMHTCSVAFYVTPGNKEMADKYGIFIGTSHCEPMMRNTNAEWNHKESGEYDYVHNRENVVKFWEERTTELAGSDNIYTLGIRGVHDGKMQGANTIQEQKEATANVIKDQREMIKKLVNPDLEKVSQVFIPYKEVLDVYNAGLEVPEDITLMWCDDNYGYITHFPDSVERNRKGGNGVYYHLSYWGRPHDYLWLATANPSLIYYQLKLAYEKGARDMWIFNVGDIKPTEYQLEFLMDMAWDIQAISPNVKAIDNHLKNFMQREFGKKLATDIAEIMKEHYRLAYIRKPEFMGNTRTEEKDPAYKIVSDLPWSKTEINQRIADYQKLEDKVKKIAASIPSTTQNSWFQLVEYPVTAASEMNKKMLFGQLARHEKSDWNRSDDAYNEIVDLTKHYNELANGKWKYMMDFSPRDLAVFKKLKHETTDKPLNDYINPLYLFNGSDYKTFEEGKPVVLGMGYQRKAVTLPQGTSVTYNFKTNETEKINLELAFVPNHPVNDKLIQFEVTLDGGVKQNVDFHTVGRSEEWKQNVLRNQAIRKVSYELKNAGNHTITIKAIDEGVILDQIKVYKE